MHALSAFPKADFNKITRQPFGGPRQMIPIIILHHFRGLDGEFGVC
jgi:hypothetical protein